MEGKVLYREGRFPEDPREVAVTLEKYLSDAYFGSEVVYLLSWCAISQKIDPEDGGYIRDEGRQILTRLGYGSGGDAKAIRLAIAKYDELKLKYQEEVDAKE